MKKAYEFLKECGTFIVLTMNEDFPAGRPFGAVMEMGDDLYISTSNKKDVYKQLKINGNVQLLALKPGTRSWVRITGVSKECESLETKDRMLKECPVLKKHYYAANDPNYNVFKIKVMNVEFY